MGRLSRRAEERFLTHQLGFLFSSRFLPEMNPIAAGMAGATRIGPGRYMLIATTSAVAWALAWMSAGYALGHVTGRMPTAFGFLTTLGFLAGAILAGWLVVRHRRRVALNVGPHGRGASEQTPRRSLPET